MLNLDEGGPISERAYRSVLKILKRARRPNYQRPGAIVFNTLNDSVAPSSLSIGSFLQPQVESTLSELSSATTAALAHQLGGGSNIDSNEMGTWPPPNGFTLSLWLSMRSFDKISQNAALPLVTIARGMTEQASGMVAFSVLLSRGEQLIITTREVAGDVHNQLEELELDPEQCSRLVQNYDSVDSVVGTIRLQPGQCHSLVIQLIRGFVKQSLCYAWLDGKCVELTNQGRLRYPGASSNSSYQLSANPSISLHSGIHKYLIRRPKCKWALHSLHFFHEVTQPTLAYSIVTMGEHYNGCYRANQLVSDEATLISLYPHNYESNRIHNTGTAGSNAVIKLATQPGTFNHPVQILSTPSSFRTLMGLGGETLFLGMIHQADTPDKLVIAVECCAAIMPIQGVQSPETKFLGLIAMLIKHKNQLATQELLLSVMKITRTTMIATSNVEQFNLIGIEHLLIDLTLWQGTHVFRSVLGHLVDIMKGGGDLGNLPHKLCSNLIRLLNDNRLEHDCMSLIKQLLAELIRHDDQFRQVGMATLASTSFDDNPSMMALTPLITVINSYISTRDSSTDSSCADRFERLFGWELPLGLLDHCGVEHVLPLLKMLSRLLLFAQSAGERFIQGNMVQKSANTKLAVNDDLAIDTTNQDQSESRENAPRTLNGFKLLERIVISHSSVDITMVLMGLLVSNPEFKNGIDDSSAPNQLTASCFSLIYTMLRSDLSSGSDQTTLVSMPRLLELYRNHLPKFGKIFFQEELVQQLCATLYPLNLDKNKLDSEMEKAQKLIIDLILALFTNSVSLASGSVVFRTVCDTVLGLAPPPATSPNQQRAVFTQLVDSVQSFVRMTNLPWNWPVHLEYQQRLTTANNLAYFLSRAVERIWEFGSFDLPLFDLVHTISNLVQRSRVNKAPYNVIQLLELAVWRCIMFNVSKSTQTEYEQLQVTSSLELIIEFKSILFPPDNNPDQISYGLILSHALFQLSGDSVGLAFSSLNNNETANPPPPIHPKLTSAINQIWKILLLARCGDFESHKGISIPPGSSIEVGKLLLRDLAKKQWSSFIETLRPTNHQDSTTSGIIRKVSGSFGKFTSASRRALQVKRTASVSDAMSWLRGELSAINESVRLEWKESVAFEEQATIDIANEWKRIFDLMINPGGLFGMDHPDPFVRWQLDTAEGPARTRRRMVRHGDFYYKYKTTNPIAAGKHRAPRSSFVEELDKARNPGLRSARSSSVISDEAFVSSEDEIQVEADIEQIAAKLKLQRPGSEPDENTLEVPLSPVADLVSPSFENVPFGSEATSQSNQPKNSVLHRRILDRGDRVRYTFRIGRVTGLDAYEGILVIGRINCYLIDGLGLTQDNKIKPIASMTPDEQVMVIPSNKNDSSYDSSNVQVHKFQLSMLRNIEKRRYLLQPIALELFLSNGRTHLVAFERSERQRALHRIIQYAGQARSTDPGAMMSTLTSKWENGEISNFEYLVILNTWAGRTYNDLMQYPIFPWVLSDYDSSVLDFSKSETFRDFSLPMGAQATERLAQFKKRYKELCELGVDSGKSILLLFLKIFYFFRTILLWYALFICYDCFFFFGST